MFAYNGLGDRLQQTENGVPTNYTLDIESGLTQVLSDGRSMYLYGVGRIAQAEPGSRAYFLGDALNSARQLVGDAGRVGLASAYEPYGDPLSIAGEMQTAYGFAGEWRDATGLVNLRARYYAPADGRFVQQDPFWGIAASPISQNPYPFGWDNPVRYKDPTGEDPISDCVGLLVVLAVADGPIPAGDLLGGLACAAILGAAGIGALTAMQHPGDAGQAVGNAVEDAVDTCRWTWEKLYQLPVADNAPEPEPAPTPAPLGPDIAPRVEETPRPSVRLIWRAISIGTGFSQFNWRPSPRDREGLSGAIGGIEPYHTNPELWFTTFVRLGELPNPATDRIVGAREESLVAAGFSVIPSPGTSADPWHVSIGGNLIVLRGGVPSWIGDKNDRAATAARLAALFVIPVWP